MVISGGGYVGIGVTNPTAKLDVSGSFKATSANITETLTANALNVNTINGNLTINEYPCKLSLGSAYSQNLSFGTSYIGFNATRDHNNGIWTLDGDGANNGGGVIWSTIWGDLLFASIPSTGTGSKTLTDLQVKNSIKLQVTNNGVLKAKEVLVTLTGWPDFVFDKNYKLLPLKEVEHFINTNQHLPNVPSATEVETHGIPLGEMNAVLIQKIEELTLYIIQMEKRLSELESKKGGE